MKYTVHLPFKIIFPKSWLTYLRQVTYQRHQTSHQQSVLMPETLRYHLIKQLDLLWKWNSNASIDVWSAFWQFCLHWFILWLNMLVVIWQPFCPGLNALNMYFNECLYSKYDLHTPRTWYASFSYRQRLATSPTRLRDRQIVTSSKYNETTWATGADGISPKILKEAVPSIAESLTKLINMSLDWKIFPESWNLANVLPLF